MEFRVGTFTSLPLERICCGLYSSLLATRSSVCCCPQTSTLDRQEDGNIYRRREGQAFGDGRVTVPSHRGQRRRSWWAPYPCRAAHPRDVYRNLPRVTVSCGCLISRRQRSFEEAPTIRSRNGGFTKFSSCRAPAALATTLERGRDRQTLC